MPQKQLAKVVTQIIDAEPDVEKDIEPSTLDDYKSLNEKCDAVMVKIKTRKSKKNSKRSGE